MAKIVTGPDLVKHLGIKIDDPFYGAKSAEELAELGALRFYYVIDTDAKLFVEAESGCSETELSSEDAITRTFVDGFEAAWGRLCKACRNTLVTFWRANAPDSHPSLELADVELAGGYNYRDYAFRFQR